MVHVIKSIVTSYMDNGENHLKFSGKRALFDVCVGAIGFMVKFGRP